MAGEAGGEGVIARANGSRASNSMTFRTSSSAFASKLFLYVRLGRCKIFAPWSNCVEGNWKLLDDELGNGRPGGGLNTLVALSPFNICALNGYD